MDVKTVYTENSGFVDKVLGSDPIEKVLTVMVANKTTRTVFVIDEERNLVGLITIKEIFKHLFDEMKPQIVKLFGKKKDLKARDIMRSAISVSLDNTLDEALSAAKAGNLQDLPVCKDGKVIGELDCFELLNGLIEENKD